LLLDAVAVAYVLVAQGSTVDVDNGATGELMMK
jgi:hypothetical protein